MSLSPSASPGRGSVNWRWVAATLSTIYGAINLVLAAAAVIGVPVVLGSTPLDRGAALALTVGSAVIGVAWLVLSRLIARRASQLRTFALVCGLGTVVWNVFAYSILAGTPADPVSGSIPGLVAVAWAVFFNRERA